MRILNGVLFLKNKTLAIKNKVLFCALHQPRSTTESFAAKILASRIHALRNVSPD
jgi:hypothetical protein